MCHLHEEYDSEFREREGRTSKGGDMQPLQQKRALNEGL